MSENLAEIVRKLGQRSLILHAKTHELARIIDTIEQRIFDTGIRKIIKAPIADGVTLGWSGRQGRWRLVIVDDDGAIPLFETEPEEWIEAFTSGAMEKIVRQAIETR